MSETTEHKLPSGAVLKFGLAPFAEGKELYQTLLQEARGITLSDDKEIDFNLMKEMICLGLASKKLDQAILECAKKCLYKGEKFSLDQFEDEKSRQDFIPIMLIVANENLRPFLKSLYASLKVIIPSVLKSFQA